MVQGLFLVINLEYNQGLHRIDGGNAITIQVFDFRKSRDIAVARVALLLFFY
jgi:hypothetical protein